MCVGLCVCVQSDWEVMDPRRAVQDVHLKCCIPVPARSWFDKPK